MSWLHRLVDTFRTDRIDRDLDDEMRFHLDMRAQAYEREGMSPAEARREALRRFGGSPLLVRERVRDARLLTWLDSVRQDAWLGVRLLRRSPALTVAAMLSLGLAIGAAVGIFIVGDALLLRTLPVPRPHDLLVPQWRSTEWPKIGIWGSNDDENNNWSFSYSMYERFSQNPGMDVAGFQDLNGGITQVNGEAGTADGSLVTGNFFRVMGVAPAAGRLLGDRDNTLGAAPAVVLSHRYWQKVFGGDRAALGRILRLNGVDFTVVGVAPPSFFGAVPGRWADFYVPACWMGRVLADFERESPLTSDKFWWLQLIVRIERGTTPAAVQATLGTQFAAMVKPRITEAKQHAIFGLRSGAQGYAFQQQEAVKPLLILASLVGLVLLIACSNVANLLLARAAARRREAAMRLALGAGWLRLVRQHLTESLVLALLSGAVGYVFARWFAAAMLALTPERSALTLDLGVTGREVAFAAGLAVAAGLLVGIVPAVSLSRTAVSRALKAGTTVRSGWRQRLGLGRPLVAVQIALSLLVLVVAGLFVRTLGNLQSVPLGFNPEGVVLFTLDPSAAGYSAERKAAATGRIAERLRTLPGVRAVTWSSFAMLENFSWMVNVSVVGEPAVKRPSCFLLWTGPGFHDVMQIPLVTGRLFDERDGRTAPKVAVVNQAFVKVYLHGTSAVGRTITVDLQPKAQTFEVVGVVRDTKYARIRQENRPIAFFPEAQQSLPVGPTFTLKVAGDAASRIAGDIARVVHELEPALPVARIRTFREQIAQQLWTERSLSLLSSAFGVVALLLAAVGLYGVVAFAVARRTPEMGVRLALGASRGAVVRLMLADSAKVVLPGAVLGIAGALAATRFIGSILFGLSPTDPPTIAAASALLLVVAAAAAYVPARRAAAVDPVDALRAE
jgi:predicted permease